MSILQQIQAWSETLPTWQRDAVARLYSCDALTVDDYATIYAHLKADHGIPYDAEYDKKTLSAEQVGARQKPGQRVQIVAIKNLRNVNALAAGQRLPIRAEGLSVIYGENGSGKSGYSRVFKKACRARDHSEPIHPNSHEEKGKSGTPQASFELLIDTVETEVQWALDKPTPEELSAIAIFDSHCARAYVDNRGDFAYAPFGLDILTKLVEVCSKMKSMATNEAARTVPDLAAFAALSQTPTAVGKLLSGLSATTKPADIAELAGLSPEHESRLTTLAEALAGPDPKLQAQTLRNKATRFSDLGQRIASAVAVIDDAKVEALRDKINKSNVAKEAAELASVAFKGAPGRLPNTGSETWKALFEAARTFVAECHPGKELNTLRAEDACPLCQSPLRLEGVERLGAFEKFVQQEAEKTEKATRAMAVAAYQEIAQAQFDLRIDAALQAELEASEEGLTELCMSVQRVLLARRDAVKKAAGPGGDWSAIDPIDPHVTGKLAILSSAMLEQAKAFDAATDEKAKQAMKDEHAELDARVRLGDLKDAAFLAIEKMVLHRKLSACVAAAGATTGISRKATELSKAVATPEVASALNDELLRLDVHELKVVMKAESVKGKPQFKLVLEVPGHGAAKDILSEGEQRAIAIASFLAEVNLNGDLGGVVFDDPVSSLDHRRRWRVARRLAEEAKRRQVIVLTHDIYFLCILQQEAARAGLEVNPQCIRKAPAGFGVQSDRLPFDTMSTSKRVKALRLMQAEAKAKHQVGDDEEKQRVVRSAYYHLRLAWERGVEEVLLQGAVQRFDEGVSTQKLSYVIVEDGDYSAIEAGMSKSSKFAHDPAAGIHLPSPHPDELLTDIETLEAWRKAVEARKDSVRARRI